MQIVDSSSKDINDLLPQGQLEETNAKTTWSDIFTNLISCTFQTALGYVCLDIMFAVSLHFIAQQSEKAASGIGFAFAVFCLTIEPIGTGFNESLNVHVAQAIGAQSNSLSKSYLTMTFYIHFFYTLPQCLLIYYLKTPFSYTFPEQDRDAIVDYAWQYLPFLMVNYIFYIEMECIKSYMLAFEVTTPFIFIHSITTSLHVFWCWLLIEQFKFGIQGAGLALIITQVLISNLLLLYFYILFSAQKKLFRGIQWKPKFEFTLLLSYIKSSYSIIIHVYVDYFVFFLLNFISMQLGSELFYAQIAFSNTNSFYFKIPISLSLGLMTYVGQEMGRREIQYAKKYTIAGALIFLCTISILLILLWSFKEQWAFFYAPNSETIRDALFQTLPFFMLGCLIVDGLQGSMSGALKGIEKKDLVSYSALSIYYLIGIPLTLYLTFSWGLNLKLTGIWLGFGIANALLCFIYIGSLFNADWYKQAEMIHDRITNQMNLDDGKNEEVDDITT